MIELQDFVDVAQAGRVNFKFDQSLQNLRGARESKSLKRRALRARLVNTFCQMRRFFPLLGAFSRSFS